MIKALRFHEFGDFSKLKLQELPEAVLATDEVKVGARRGRGGRS